MSLILFCHVYDHISVGTLGFGTRVGFNRAVGQKDIFVGDDQFHEVSEITLPALTLSVKVFLNLH
ncbi:hypothetical protein J6TS7_51670 [Paenibacillus dendritiformis]|nr:hypothetical protein J6TS7_51670 [Paenibacillus dendritiformis]